MTTTTNHGACRAAVELNAAGQIELQLFPDDGESAVVIAMAPGRAGELAKRMAELCLATLTSKPAGRA